MRKPGTNKTSVKCLNCQNEFIAKKSEIDRGKGKYCSRSCAKTAINHTQTGENNPFWKGGISKDNYHYKKLQIERYPDHVSARATLENAVRTGKIEKNVCEVCGDKNTVAHHDDYSQPLKVRWLCHKHHREIHGNLR